MAKRYLTPNYKTVLNPITSFSIPKTLWDNATKHVYQGYDPFSDIRDKSLVEALIEIIGLQVQRLNLDYFAKLEIIELDECLYIQLDEENKENDNLSVGVFEIIEIESLEEYQKIHDDVKNRFNTLNYLFNRKNKMTTNYYFDKLKWFLKE